MSPSILIIDDEPQILNNLEALVQMDKHAAFTAKNGQAALKLLEREGSFDLVISDIRLPDIDGINLLREMKKINPDMDAIMITGFGTMETCYEALKLGASDYIIKPFSNDQMRFLIARVFEQRRLKKENKMLRESLEQQYTSKQIIGDSKAIHSIHNIIRKVADLPSTVLITGESGTGKELVAAGIHYSGIRRTKPFVTVNCGALPETLLESELFGHKKGAFTGAIDNKQGLLETANGGTFLLDEVGDMTPAMQVKLLRFLTERKFKRLGGTQDITVDVRIIAATNKNLEQLVKAGKFRNDLFYRLNVIPIQLPSLRERMEDVPMLVQYFLDKYSVACGTPVKTVNQAVIQLFMQYPWPGNVRELENLIERLVALEPGSEISIESIPLQLQIATAPAEFSKEFYLAQLKKQSFNLDEIINNLEKDLILAVLERTKGRKKEAAKQLNISFRSFRYRLVKHGLTKGDEEDLEELEQHDF